jgi:rubrerythrin
MHREKLSMHLYNNLADITTDPTTRQMFINLAAQETAHKLYFETLWDEKVLTEN